MARHSRDTAETQPRHSADMAAAWPRDGEVGCGPSTAPDGEGAGCAGRRPAGARLAGASVGRLPPRGARGAEAARHAAKRASPDAAASLLLAEIGPRSPPREPGVGSRGGPARRRRPRLPARLLGDPGVPQGPQAGRARHRRRLAPPRPPAARAARRRRAVAGARAAARRRHQGAPRRRPPSAKLGGSERASRRDFGGTSAAVTISARSRALAPAVQGDPRHKHRRVGPDRAGRLNHHRRGAREAALLRRARKHGHAAAAPLRARVGGAARRPAAVRNEEGV